jgi:hypothetical protein
MTSDPTAATLSELLARVRAGWPPGATWEWDGRLRCAVSAVSDAQQAPALAVLTANLPAGFSHQDLGGAPAAVQQVCGRTGGLQPGQRVFTADLPGGALAYCLWWPWGSGTTVSARLGASGGAADLNASVRAAFALR